MNGNSVATEIEKQTGLKRSTKTKKYAQETGGGNIAYGMRFAGYNYKGDFHVSKAYSNIFEFHSDSPETKSRIDDILQVLKNLGLEIVYQQAATIGFKIPLDENKWSGHEGMYRKGKWSLYKNWRHDGEYTLYNSEDENFHQTIQAYNPSQARYSADYFIEQFEKGEIMNSRNIKSSFDKTIFSKSPNKCKNEKIADICFTINGTPLELTFKMDSYWDRAYLTYPETGAMIEIPEDEKDYPLYQILEELLDEPFEFDDVTLTDVYAAHQIESSKKSIKSAKNFAEKTPYDIVLDNGKQINKGTVFNVDYDRNEQGEYVIGISVNGLGETQLRFDSENDAFKRGWIIESSRKSIKSGNIPAKGSDSEKLFAKISKKVPSAKIKGNNEEGHYIEIPNDGKISENYMNGLSEDLLYDGYKVIDDKIRIYFDEGDFSTYSIKSGNIYDYNNCSFCGNEASGTLKSFLEKDGYDVETACDILDVDPLEVVCEDCYKSWKPELDTKMHSEYDDLGTDVRTGEPFPYPVQNGFDRNKESLNIIFNSRKI